MVKHDLCEWIIQSFQPFVSHALMRLDFYSVQSYCFFVTYTIILFSRFLSWARTQKCLKVISSDVPSTILPQGWHGKLHDIRISCYGPDDEIYDENAKYRSQVSFCCS